MVYKNVVVVGSVVTGIFSQELSGFQRNWYPGNNVTLLCVLTLFPWNIPYASVKVNFCVMSGITL